MSDLIGFVFGALCGSILTTIIILECLKPTKQNLGKPKVAPPISSCHHSYGKVDTTNPPKGGSGYPSRLTSLKTQSDEPKGSYQFIK